MISNGGKNFLRTCLTNIDASLNVDKIFAISMQTESMPQITNMTNMLPNLTKQI
jgi:hypothetical protein